MNTGEVATVDRQAHSAPIAVVVLAAGQGRRLGPVSASHPKWIAQVGDRRIADYQTDAFEACLAEATDRVVIVAGHGIDALYGWLAERNSGLPIEVVQNPHYAKFNNWYSLLVGLRYLDAAGWRHRVVIVNSDLCAAVDWYSDFLLRARLAPEVGICLAVDFDRPIVEEAMKVTTQASDQRLVCRAIGKAGVSDPDGEYVGLAVLGLHSWRRKVMGVLESFYTDCRRHDDWYEAAFRYLIEDGVEVVAWGTPDSQWVEIDTLDDLLAARRLMTLR